MQTILGIAVLLAVVTLGLIIMRIATVALMLTGVSHELARFQARSAFTGCGFTTRESESIAQHPVRRRIVMVLMLLGNGTVVMAITALVPVFVNTKGSPTNVFANLFWLALGLAVLWLVASSKWLDRRMTRIIGWALTRFSRMAVYDFSGLLHLSEGYSVSETVVGPEDWVTGKNLIELRLADEGVQVLGIQRADGTFIGTPTGKTYIRSGDKLLLYGRVEHIAELKQRPADTAGDKAHEERIREHRRDLEVQQERERHRTDEEYERGESPHSEPSQHDAARE